MVPFDLHVYSNCFDVLNRCSSETVFMKTTFPSLCMCMGHTFLFLCISYDLFGMCVWQLDIFYNTFCILIPFLALRVGGSCSACLITWSLFLLRCVVAGAHFFLFSLFLFFCPTLQQLPVGHHVLMVFLWWVKGHASIPWNNEARTFDQWFLWGLRSTFQSTPQTFQTFH